jgi:hypothetical protein
MESEAKHAMGSQQKSQQKSQQPQPTDTGTIADSPGYIAQIAAVATGLPPEYPFAKVHDALSTAATSLKSESNTINPLEIDFGCSVLRYYLQCFHCKLFV